MRQIYLEDAIFEFSESEFLLTIRDTGEDVCRFAGYLYSNCVSGYPDVISNRIKLVERSIFSFKREEAFHSFEREIEDNQLREMFSTLWVHLKKIEDIHGKVVEWVAKFFGIYPLATDKDQKHLFRILDRGIKKSRRLKMPFKLAIESEYQASVKEMAVVYTSMLVLQDQISDRVDQLVEKLGEEEIIQHAGTKPLSEEMISRDDLPPSMRKLVRPYGWTPNREGDLPLEEVEKHAQEVLEKHGMVDQKVSDLVEEAELEIDPREAIQVLRKALRYSPHGIGASKVYFYIAMKYEDLGDKTRAIKYYTKSIEETEPSSIVLYYRGLLHHEKGQLAEARRDIEQAIALSGLDSYDLEQARNYLTEIDKQISIRPSDKPKKKKKE